MSIPRRSRIVKAMTKQEKEFFRAAMTLVTEERSNMLKAFLERFSVEFVNRVREATKGAYQMRDYLEKQMVALNTRQDRLERQMSDFSKRKRP